MKTRIAGAGLAAVALLTVWLWLPADGGDETTAPASPPAQETTSRPPSFTSPLQESVEVISRPSEPVPRPDSAQPVTGEMDPAAINALRDTRDGDSRAPEIGVDQRAWTQRSGPPPSDYRDYLSYQHEQQRRHHAAYVHAAKERLAEIDKQLEWGRANGVPDEQLKMAREKRQRLAAAQRRLLDEDPALETDFPEPEPLRSPER